MTKTPKQFAKDLVDKYVNLPIHFPYIDSEDGQCIGSGYMAWESAKECAKICVDKIIESIPTQPSESKMERTDAITYYVEVKSEIEQLIN